MKMDFDTMNFAPKIRSFIRSFGPAPTKWLLGAGALCAFSFSAFAWRKGSPEQDAAPGAPGRTPHWTPSAKQGVGTSLGAQSNVWFTLFHGLVTERTVFSHPVIPVVFERVRFVPLAGKLEDYRVHVIVSPHLGNEGWHNDAWVGDYKGQEMLFAQEDNHCAAIGASVPWENTSVGYTGVSDGRWQPTLARLASPSARVSRGDQPRP